MNHLVAIVGPTGVGKSQLAVCLAQAFNGEIVNADSRQVYRFMDIGTGKPTPELLRQVPHHLIGVINPSEDFSLAQYQKMAEQAVSDIIGRDKLPLLVGGSGLYVRAVLEGWGIPRIKPKPELRRRLEEKALKMGTEWLYRELEVVDPQAASRVDRQNLRRIIRALEVHHGGGGPSPQPSKEAPAYDILIIGLTLDREELYRRIDARVDKMVKHGMVEEVSRLMAMDYGPELPAMSAIGYRQIGMYLRGELCLEAAVQQIKYESHRFVRQQYNWFGLKDDRISWFDVGGSVYREIEGLLASFIDRGKMEKTRGLA
jgi:tRNA dimethylallyltransferase